MDVFDLEALAGDVDPLALAAELRRKGAAIPALRRRENLAELGLLGGPDLAPMAQAMGQNARAQIGDANAERQMVLKRALWNQQKQAERPASEEELAAASEALGVSPDALRVLPRGIVLSQAGAAVGRRARYSDEDRRRAEAMSSPEAIAERDLERKSKEAILAEKRASLASRPGANEAELRKEWIGQAPYKNAQAAIEQYAKVENASPDAAGDLSLIFSYMKMLDPGSAVREGEFANAQNAAGIPDRIAAAYNRALNGERLSAEARNRFRKEAEGVLRSTLDAYEQNAEFYRGIARERGFKVENVVPPMRRIKSRSAASPSAPAKPGGSSPGTGGRIRVRVKDTGLTGTMPAENFDPAKYERID